MCIINDLILLLLLSKEGDSEWGKTKSRGGE